MLRRDISVGLLATVAGSTLLSREAQAQTCTLPCYPLTAAESAAGVTPQDYSVPEANLLRYLSPAQAADFQAGTLGQDLSSPLQQWLNVAAGRIAFMPRGFARHGTPLLIAAGTIVAGCGAISRFIPWGCDGLRVVGDFVTLRDFQIHSYASNGLPDPKTHVGIDCQGVYLAPHANVDIANVSVRGFLRGIDWRYTWSSRLSNVDTIFCTTGLRLLGESVNNTITDCRLLATGSGSACISLESDSGRRGEGLAISGCLLASAERGMKSDALGFLSIGIDTSTIIDLISGKAFELSNVQAFKCSAQWVYSTDTCFDFSGQGASTQIDASINVGKMTCTGAVSAVRWGANNVGLQLGGNVTTTNASSGYPIAIIGSGATVTAYVSNANSSAQGTIVFTAGNTIQPNGDRSVAWQISPVATVASATAITLPRNGCAVFSISGASTIAFISPDGWDGQEATLVAVASFGLTTGSNLKLAGNLLATADDTIKLVCVGSNWYEVSRSAN